MTCRYPCRRGNRRRRMAAVAAAVTLAGWTPGAVRAHEEIPGRVVLRLTEDGVRARGRGALTVPFPPGGTDLEPRIEPLFPGAPPPLDRFLILTFRASRASDPRAQNALWSRWAMQSRSVAAAEPDRVLSLSALPDDPYFAGAGGLPRQWHLFDPGGLSLHADAAWPFVPAGSGVVVAVLDSGVDWDHPDLGGSAPPGGVIRINAAEAGGAPGVDDDENGFVDDIVGWDFVEIGDLGSLPQQWLPIGGEDGTVPDNDPSDVLGHGTYISGLITALDRNGAGIAAASPGVRLLPVRVGWASRDGGGKVAMSFCAQGLVYAAMNGAQVANCSWDSQDLAGLGAALDLAIDTYDMVIVGAAGNGNTSNTGIEYLAARPDCIGVAGIFRNGSKGTVSNYGPWVDIAGFYKGMVSTWIGAGSAAYDTTFQEGTSWAAPNVSALAALLRAVDPLAGAAAIRLTIATTGRDLSDVEPAFADQLGGGLVRYPEAVRALGGGWEADIPARGLTLTGEGGSGVVFLGESALGRITAGDGSEPPGWAGGEAYAGPAKAFLPLVTPWAASPPLAVWGDGGFLRAVPEPGTAVPGWPVLLPAGTSQPVAATVAGADRIYLPHAADVLAVFPSGGTVDTLRLGIPVVSLAVSGSAPDGTVLFAGDDGNGTLVLWTDGPSGPSAPRGIALGILDTPPVIGEFDGPGLPEAVAAGPDTTSPLTRRTVYFADRTGTLSRSPHGLDAAPIRFLSLAGFADGMSVRVVAVDSAHVLHLFAPAPGLDPFPGAAARDLGGPITGEVLCADLNGDYQSDLLALRTDGTLLAFTADLAPLAGFPRHFPSGFDENPVVVDDGNRRYVVAADTTGRLWSLPTGPAGRPAPWPATRGTAGRTAFLGHARATPVSPAVSSFTWQRLDARGRACWSGSALDGLLRLRVRGDPGGILWEGPPADAGCVGLAPSPGSLYLEGLSRGGGWTRLATTAVDSPPAFRVGTPFPNPFRAETQLSWSAVPEAPRVEIFDVQGRLVLRARSVDGASYRWRGTDDRGRPVAPGLYFVRITGAGSTAVRRVFKVP